jgi:hypothetical protein
MKGMTVNYFEKEDDHKRVFCIFNFNILCNKQYYINHVFLSQHKDSFLHLF